MQKPVVLIVEDDFMIADCLEEILVEAGFTVCGIAATVAEAIALGEQRDPDLGVIDLRLAEGGVGTDVAAALRLRGGFGVLYASGNPDHPLLQSAEGEASIGKPYTAKSVVAALGIVREKMSGLPLSAFPQGFRLLENASV
jgi:DNA-binding response OmpR family regulator